MTTTPKATRKRVRRRLLIATVVIAGASFGIYIAAEIDMARERAVRRYLGDQLYTEIRGSGDPVVFLAGLQGSTKYWGSAFEPLLREHRLIFVDALGFGRSPWPSDIGYTLDDQVDALRRTLQAKHATRNVTFVAHSFGTIIAAAYTSRFPDEVSRVVLLGTPIFADEQQARERIRRMTTLGALFTFNKTLANVSCMTMCAFRPLLRRVLPAMRPELDPDVVADSVLHDLPAVDGAVNRILLKERVQESLRRIGPKTVLIHGRADAVTPIEDARRLANETDATLIEVEGNHHQYFAHGIDLIRQAIEP